MKKLKSHALSKALLLRLIKKGWKNWDKWRMNLLINSNSTLITYNGSMNLLKNLNYFIKIQVKLKSNKKLVIVSNTCSRYNRSTRRSTTHQCHWSKSNRRWLWQTSPPDMRIVVIDYTEVCIIIILTKTNSKCIINSMVCKVEITKRTLVWHTTPELKTAWKQHLGQPSMLMTDPLVDKYLHPKVWGAFKLKAVKVSLSLFGQNSPMRARRV